MDIIFILFLVSAPVFYFIGLGVILKLIFGGASRKERTLQTPIYTKAEKSHTKPAVLVEKTSVHQTPRIPSFLHDPKQHLRFISILLGLAYVLCVKWGQLPTGLQAPLLTLLWSGAIVYLTSARGWVKNWRWWALLFFFNVVAFSLFITTNPLLDIINRVTLFGLSIFWLVFLSQGHFPTKVIDVLKDSSAFFFSLFIQLMNTDLYRNFFALPKVSWKNPKINGQKTVGLLISLPVLIIFHLLFIRINADYNIFMNSILQRIWDVLKYIWELDIWIVALKTLITSFLFLVLLAPKSDQEKTPVSAEHQNFVTIFNTVLTSCVALFALFVFFQSRLLLLNFATLTFKALSTYVIQGFWELIVVSLIGYIVILVTLYCVRRNKQHRPSQIKVLLTVFTLELVTVIFFTFHKLFIHQALFGLKDQRILATAGVVLILLTYCLSLLRFWGKTTSQLVFQVQLFAFLSTVVLLNVMNIDLFVTRVNPIHYYVNDQQYKDYSYLLGNSFDNSDEWLKLVAEAKAEQPPQPEDYYYGWYPAFCQGAVSQGPSLHFDRYRHVAYRSYLQNKYQYLTEKYDHLESKQLPEKLAINLHEYQAYQLVSSHKEEFEEVVQLFCVKQSQKN